MCNPVFSRVVSRFKKRQKHLVLSAVLLCLAIPASANDVEIEAITSLSEKTDLQDKMFRKALFYYYQQKPSLALQQLSYNKIKFGALPANSQLFEAGLQITLGMPQQAQENLLSLVASLPDKGNTFVKSNVEYLDHNDLMSVALLALAEQQVSMANFSLAQQTLGKLVHIPNAYYDQYRQLSQLAYWPNEVVLIAKPYIEHDDDEAPGLRVISENNAFILINNAIRLIELQDYEQAYEILTQVQQYKLVKKQPGFWASLFSGSGEEHLEPIYAAEQPSSKRSETEQEARAIRDYAGLLIAQMHVSLGMYQAAYDDLSAFPQFSPYTEQALFLYAYSASKKQFYAQSTAGFKQLNTKFPHSDLSWQGLAINAKQFEQQGLLDHALAEYMSIENMFRSYLTDLKVFSESITPEIDMLSYTKDRDGSWSLNREFRIHNELTFSTTSPWLAKAVKDIELSIWFQQLIELNLLTEQLHNQQLQTEALANLIALNEHRQRQIALQTKNDKFQQLFDKLSLASNSLSAKFAHAKGLQNGQAFANSEQQQWLARIELSRERISRIAPLNKNQNYQERLARVEGVLAWSLKKQQPPKQQQSAVMLARVEKQLTQTKQQLARVNLLLSKDLPLTPASIKQQKVVNRINHHLAHIDTISSATNEKIKVKLKSFVRHQETQLKRHLLVTQRSMARVIEQIDRQEMLEQKRLINQVGNSDVSEFIAPLNGDGQ